MPDINKTSSHPAPSFRRGIDLVVFGAIGLLVAVVASWRWCASPFSTEERGSFPVSMTYPPDTKQSVVVSHETATTSCHGQMLAALLAEADSPERKRAILNTLQAWIRSDPEAIAAWVRSQTAFDGAELLTELFATAGVTPRDAVSLTESLVRTNATTARDFGYALIFGLNRRGEFSASAGYATAAPEGMRRDLVIAAYHDWGRRQPEQAFLSAAQIANPTARQFAMQSVLSGWARSSPEELAETALRFPAGDEKNAALTKALRAWMVKDPWKAGDWILAHEVAVPVAENFFARDER